MPFARACMHNAHASIHRARARNTIKKKKQRIQHNRHKTYGNTAHHTKTLRLLKNDGEQPSFFYVKQPLKRAINPHQK